MSEKYWVSLSWDGKHAYGICVVKNDNGDCLIQEVDDEGNIRNQIKIPKEKVRGLIKILKHLWKSRWRFW